MYIILSYKVQNHDHSHTKKCAGIPSEISEVYSGVYFVIKNIYFAILHLSSNISLFQFEDDKSVCFPYKAMKISYGSLALHYFSSPI